MLGKQLYGITCPLLTKSDGAKMGKTESGAIYLSPERTSPYEFYQYWVRVEDDDVGMCLRFLTELTEEEIKSLDLARAAEPHQRASQKRLAEEVTKLIHGEAGLKSAKQATEILFGAEIADLSDKELQQIFADVQSVALPMSRLNGGISIVDALVEAGLAKSKGASRRTVEQGGAYVNNQRVESIEKTLSTSDLASETVIVLRSGKKKYALMKFDG